jgi:histone deacetylase complex regulatory component SIN3
MQTEMETLFKDEPDLVKGFEEFLPVLVPKATEDKGGELGDAAI